MDNKDIVKSNWLKKIIYLEWSMTTWCNFKCPYCSQEHKKSKETHCFDFANVEDWVNAFDKHFKQKKLSIKLSGGECFLDVKNMVSFINSIIEKDYLESIRIDTNSSFISQEYSKLNKKEKIWLMCTFHPSQINFERFLKNIDFFLDQGFNIGFVNYVLTNENLSEFKKMHLALKNKKIPLHPNPLWDRSYNYSSEALEILNKYVPERDLIYRSGKIKTIGKNCLFPAIAYQMNNSGQINVACKDKLFVNFLECEKLPILSEDYTSCPIGYCMCLNRYSFLEGFNRNFSHLPIKDFKKDLIKRY